MFLVINELSPRPRQDRVKLLMRISNGSVLFLKDYWMLYIWKQLLKSWGSLLCKIIPTFLSYLILFKLLCCYNQEVTHQVLRKMPLYGKTTGDLTRKRASDTRTPTMELSTDGAFHSFSYSCLLLRNEYALCTRCYCSN